MPPLLTIPPLDCHLQTLIQLAVTEDLGAPPTDLTVNLAIPEGQTSTATIVARKPGVLAGLFLLGPILVHYTPNAKIEPLTRDGSTLTANQPVATIAAPTRALLSAERLLLNFLSHLSGIATLTAQYVAAIAGLPNPPAITDTRKTIPGFRVLDKYAVRCGGGVNHRLGLYDGVMLKDNHLAALREHLGASKSLAQVTSHIRQQIDPAITLWLEVDTLEQFAEELAGRGKGADIVLLDNFSAPQMKQAVAMRSAIAHDRDGRHPLLEASGGVTLDNLYEVAATGVDRIAIGAITHSAPILDLSMEFDSTV